MVPDADCVLRLYGMSVMKFLMICLLSLMSSAGNGSGVKDNIELMLTASGTIEIDPEGKVHHYELETRLAPNIADAIDRNVRRWQFEPIRVDGRAVIAKTRLEIELKATPAGDGYTMRIDGVRFGSPKDRRAPKVGRGGLRYPPPALRESLGAYVLLAVLIDEEGRVADVHPYQTSLGRVMSEEKAARWRAVFEQTAMSSARQWLFEPGEHVGGKPVSSSVIAPIIFQTTETGRRPRPGDWRAFVPGPIAPAPWMVEELIQDSARFANLKDGVTRSTSSLFRLKNDVVGTAL